jgi:hypothetical protein
MHRRQALVIPAKISSSSRARSTSKIVLAVYSKPSPSTSSSVRLRSRSSKWRQPSVEKAKRTSASTAARRGTPSSRLKPMYAVVQPGKGLPRMRTPNRLTTRPVK